MFRSLVKNQRKYIMRRRYIIFRVNYFMSTVFVNVLDFTIEFSPLDFNKRVGKSFILLVTFIF